MTPRNSPCPCGSYRKFKKCCGTAVSLQEKRRLEIEAFREELRERRRQREAEFERKQAEWRLANPGKKLPAVNPGRLTLPMLIAATACLGCILPPLPPKPTNPHP